MKFTAKFSAACTWWGLWRWRPRSAAIIPAAANVSRSCRPSVTFEETNDKTKLTLTTGASGSGGHVSAMLAGLEQGWGESLDKLAKLFG